MTASNDANQPAPGTDSRVEDWFGQSAERDAELADRLTDELGEEDAEAAFDQQATGRDEQDARHGDRIDPDQGRSRVPGRRIVTAGAVIVVVVGIAAVVAVVGWFVLRRNEPEDAASHPEPDRTGSAQFFGDVNDRPAGPGAEADGVAGPGEPVPGPSAEADAGS